MTIYINFQTPFKTRLYIKVEENWPSSFREEDISRLNDFIHVYSPGERADNPGADNPVTGRVCYFDYKV